MDWLKKGNEFLREKRSTYFEGIYISLENHMNKIEWQLWNAKFLSHYFFPFSPINV